MSDSPYNNFPSGLGNVTFGAGVRVGEYGTPSYYDNLNPARDLHVWSAAALGPELHTQANAASDPNGNEANATAGWSLYGVGASLTSDSAAPGTGTYSLKLVAGAGAAASMGYSFGTSLKMGRLYRLSFQYKSAATQNVRVCSSGTTHISLEKSIPVTANWTSFTIYFVTLTDDVDDHKLYFMASASQTTQVDNLSVCEVMGGDVIARGLFTGGGSGGIKVQSDGKVGIGTTAPQHLLEVNGYTVVGSNTKGIRMRTDGSLVDLESLGAGLAINYLTGQNTYMNVSSGSVGIGTATPGQKLDVVGNIRLSGSLYVGSRQVANSNGCLYA